MYIESSHANNTGVAKFVNDCLYDTKTPSQLANSNCRTTINGFPIELYINGEYMGVYNFNHDRYSYESYGYDYTKNPNMLVYEINSNSNVSAGAFFRYGDKAESSANVTELEYYKRDFNLIYGNRTSESDTYSEIKELVEWVSVAEQDLFRESLDEHFNREYLFRYFLMVLLIGGVDSLGKNLKINTWDGKIWYPTFYDLDTVLGIDNTGYLTVPPDVEIEDGSYNTSNSNLWSKVWTYFRTELKEEWANMRKGQFTLENLMKYIYGEQISKIPAKLYNDDAEVKYLAFGSLYTYCCHGNKEHQIKRWLRERIAYVDSMLGYFTSVDDQITIRMNKSGYVEFEVTPYIPLYLSVKWSNATGGTQTFRVKRGETMKFYYNSTTSKDQEIIIPYATHIKRLDNLSNLIPSSCILSNAKKLTNIEIHSSKLYNINVTNNIYLRSINLENCTDLGTVTATGSSLDLSNCKYLQYVNVYNTNLTEVQLNSGGGSLTEIYYPKTIQSIQLIKQRLLEVVGLPYGVGGSEIPTSLYNINIQECSSIKKLNTSTDPTIASSFASMIYCNNLTLRNSLDLKTLNFNGFHRLSKVIIENMYTLESAGFNDLLPKGEASTIEYIGLSNCPLLETVELNCTSDDYEITLADDAILNFGKLFSLKSIRSNSILKGIKTIVVPTGLESMYFTNEYGSGYSSIENIWSQSVCDVNTDGETAIVTHINGNYKGIDFKDMNLLNIDLGALVNIPRAINFSLSPTDVNPNFNINRDGSTYPYLRPVGTLDLSNYVGSLSKFFNGVDLETLKIVVNNELPQTDLSYCFYNATFNSTYPIVAFLSNISSVTNLDYCFYRTSISGLDILSEITLSENATMNYAFAECPNLKLIQNITIPEKVVSIEGMFSGCPLVSVTNLTVNVAGAIKDLFNGCSNLIEISGFRIPNATDVSGLFNGCSSLTKLSGFKIPSGCTSVSNLFYGCDMLTALSNITFDSQITSAENWYPPYIENLNSITINTDAVKLTNVQTLKSVRSMVIGANGDMSDLFNGCSLLREAHITITGEVTSLARAFANCNKLEILSPFIVSETCTDLSDMVNGCSLIVESPIFEIPDAVTNITNLFKGCTNITDISGMTFGSGITTADTWYPPNLTTANNVTIKNDVVTFQGNTTLQYCNNLRSYYAKSFEGCKALVELKNLLIKSEDGTVISAYGTNAYRTCSKLKIIKFDPNCKIKYISCDFMFIENPLLEEVDFGGGVTLEPKDSGNAVFESTAMKTIKNMKVGGTSTRARFSGYSTNDYGFNFPNLEYLDCTIMTQEASKFFKGSGIKDVSNIKFDTSIEDLSESFMNNRLLLQDVEIQSHIRNCSSMFRNCTALTHIHSNWNNSYDYAITATDCYSGCTAITHIDGESVLAYKGDNSLDYIPIEWGGNGLADDGTISILEVTIPSDNYALKLFHYNYNFSRRGTPDRKYWDSISSSNRINWGDGESYKNDNSDGASAFPTHTYARAGVYYIKGHFGRFGSEMSPTIATYDFVTDARPLITKVLKWAYLGHNDVTNEYKETNLKYAFTGLSSVKSISGLKSTNRHADLSGLCQDCSSLISIDLSDCDTSSVTTMVYMFNRCSSLTSLDLSSFNTSNVTTMESMFTDCKSLTTIVGLENFVTGQCEDLRGMFQRCEKLTSLDLSTWNVSNVVRIGSVFAYCTALTNINVSGWNLSRVKSLSYIFQHCSSLKDLDLSSWDVSRVTQFSSIFFNCTALETLNISTWDVSSASDEYGTRYMFDGCNSLKSNPYTGIAKGHGAMSSIQLTSTALPAELDFGGFTFGEKFGSLWELRLPSHITRVTGLRTTPITQTSFRFLNVLEYLDSYNITKNYPGLPPYYYGGLSSVPNGGVTILFIGDYTSADAVNFFLRYSTGNYAGNKGGLTAKLSAESLVSFISCLHDFASEGKTGGTLYFRPEAISRLTSAQLAVATRKGWTIVAGD